MLVSRLRQRLTIPTVLVRAIGAPAAVVLLLVLVVGCGGQASTANKAEKQPTTKADKAEKTQKQQTKKENKAEKQQTKSDPSKGSPKDEEDIEKAVREHYDELRRAANGVNAKDSLAKSYSYFGPTFRSQHDKQIWIDTLYGKGTPPSSTP